MKRPLIIIILTLIWRSIFCQDIPTKEYYPNGQLRLDCPLVNGKYEGVCRMWSSDGMLYSQSTFENGKLNGHSTMWYPNGQVQSESDYSNGFQFSTILYDTLGNTILRNFISEHKTRKQIWTSSGRKIYDEKYKNAIPVSCTTSSGLSNPGKSYTSCYYKGELVTNTDGQYTDSAGKVIDQNFSGYLKQWYENGAKKSKIRFKSGKVHGRVLEWNSEGTLIRKEIYRNGILKPA